MVSIFFSNKLTQYFRFEHLVDEGEEKTQKYHLKWAIIGVPAKRHLYGVSLPGRCWRNTECLFGTFVAS